jgi:AcrR family transcriptional regulator
MAQGPTNGSGNGNGERTRGAAARASARREREREIVEATRALFDERGVQDAPMEEIARAVGINKALIYRHFASQEELFVLTVTHYLAQLAERFAEVDESLDPLTQLREVSERYVNFCLEYPAFLDCALSLMRRPFEELGERVSPGVLFRLGQAMSACLSRLSRVLAAGAEQGVFQVNDPDFLANHLYAQGLGAMHLARVAAGVRELAPGVPQMFPVDPKDVMRTAIDTTFAYVLAPSSNGHGSASSEPSGDRVEASSADAQS